MIYKPFRLNERFIIHPELHLVEDSESGSRTRLEPRIMQLLCLLAEQEGKLVTREQLIRDIWNDYGGAEDGLNGAVSSLRKALKDSDKKIIETVPKKGYVLYAAIRPEEATTAPVPVPVSMEPSRRKAFAAAFFLVVLLFAGLGLWHLRPEGKVQATPETRGNQSVNVPFSKLKAAEETYGNTITTTAPDGTRFRLVAVGDRRPELYINEVRADEQAEEAHAELIHQLQLKLWTRQKAMQASGPSKPLE